MEQAERRAVRAQTDPERMIDASSQDVSTLLGRAATMLAVVRTAAETEAEMRDLYVELHAARRRNLARFVAGLAEIGGLREGLDRETATSHVWSLGSPDLFLLWTGPTGRRPRSLPRMACGRLEAPLRGHDTNFEWNQIVCQSAVVESHKRG
ncbi:hypothetical protein [Rhizobium sullae]|uniref:hypothetical protein n=1 Tax=Rhizobium sullae TaxID=50338 RepID=UPI000B34ACED|nr:hypothetical protein [Rhizobium sullae]